MSDIHFLCPVAGSVPGREPRGPEPVIGERDRPRPAGAPKRPPMSAEQRAKLSAAQLAYVARDPRWPEHRRKLAAAQEARRMTLFDNEVAAILEMRKKGRTFSYIAEEIGVGHDTMRRELRARGIPTAPVKADRRARRGRGFWRSFD